MDTVLAAGRRPAEECAPHLIRLDGRHLPPTGCKSGAFLREVPRQGDTAGRQELGTRLGELSNAVIIVHLESKMGPITFWRLKELWLGGNGDRCQRRWPGARLVVPEPQTYPLTRRPSSAWLAEAARSSSV